MHRSLLAAIVVLSVSCGTGQPTYLDRVRPLGTDQAHRLVLEVLPLIQKPAGRTPDELMRTWKEYLGDASLPLRQDKTLTFVYYDFSNKLNRVFVEASFAPGRLEPLGRVGTTNLFYRTYEVPKPERLKYRYSDGTNLLVDPFHADVLVGTELWQQAAEADDNEITVQRVVGASEAALEGQDVGLALPPLYRRNLAWTYPVVVIVGLASDEWVRPLAQLMEQNAIRPLVAVLIKPKTSGTWTTADLKATLENRVVPWVRSRYRVSILPSDMVLVGWGDSAKVVQDVAASRTDFWTKTWIPSATQAQGEDAWNSQAQAWLRSQYGIVAP